MRGAITLTLIVLILVAAFQAIKIKEQDARAQEAGYISQIEHPTSVVVTLDDNMSRKEIVKKIGDLLGYDGSTTDQFYNTYRSMQWDAFNEVLVPYLVSTYELTDLEREILLTHATVYLDRENDILDGLYLSQNYTFSSDSSIVDVANALIKPLYEVKEEMVPKLLKEDNINSLLEYVQDETELLPDLVPLPPQDVGVQEKDGKTLLTFTTIYYNNGDGPLELIADPKTIGTPGDFDREVYQRIYRDNGTYRDKSAGTFEWHQQHLHYHFIDFIEYTLADVDGEDFVIKDELAKKTTFCVRDVSRVELEGKEVDEDAQYRICGRERQGVSVGWGDAYFSTYSDQSLDISNLPTGRYRLSFLANPSRRFEETTYDDNEASAIIYYDKEAMTVKVLSHTPKELPSFEHIHVDQS